MTDTPDMTIAENSYYDHDEHGRVRLVSVDHAAGTVALECLDATVRVRGGRIPKGVTEVLGRFRRHAQPADIAVAMPTAATETATPAPGSSP